MINSQDLPALTRRKSVTAFSWILSMIAGLALSMNFAMAQEEAGDAEEEEALELQDVRVTGSRLNRPPSELSGNLIVLDRDDIRASGELTLARVLRQLPQNVNATNETYGSTLNGATNLTGASTVNLRGLGSESTLILIDGRRVGYSGILGGVTDISTIPLSMVERIEILLDGASAIYGSDAVGGVVNIITRKDYSGVELDLNYGRPHKSGYDESRASASAGFAWEGGRANVAYEYFYDSGLDSSQRDSLILSNRSSILTTGQKNTAPGPQVRVYSYFFNDTCIADAPVWDTRGAILYELDGSILTLAEYAALDSETQAMATCINDFTLPLGYQPGDDLNGIDLFGEPHWGEEAEVGFSLRPEQRQSVVNLGVDQELGTNLTLHANVRYATKDSKAERGLPGIGGTLHANSPFNPFGKRVSLSGLAIDQPPQHFESQTDELFSSLGLEGQLGTWQWQAEFGSSRSELESTQFNTRDPAYGLGINSDGVSEAVIARFSGIDQAACAAKLGELGGTRFQYSSFFGGNCTIYGAPPDPINPFGDISPWIIPGLDAGATNKQTQFEALARGNLLTAPGGPIAMVVGYDYRQESLDSYSEFSTIAYLGGSTPAGTSVFNTDVSRDANAAFLEALVPLVGSGNRMSGVQLLNLTLSGRYDSYSNVEADYRQTATGVSGVEDLADPGSEFTWSSGFVYQPVDAVRLKAQFSTAFVAPQLNQLLQRANLSAGTRQLLFQNDDGSLSFGQATVRMGGNDQLTPETADVVSLTGEFSPAFLPGVYFKASWSDTDYVDRIVKLQVPGIIEDQNNLPPNVIYLADQDAWIVDDRWTNVAALQRTGMDYELRYEWEMGENEFTILVRRGYTNRYDVQQYRSLAITQSLVGERDDTGDARARTTLPPVPKHQTSAQFMWMRGGLFFSLDVQGADTTRIVSSANTQITEPATNYDLVLGYEFGSDTLFDAPSWMERLDATLAINNLTNAFAENSRLDPETGQRTVSLLNPFYEWTQGRAYRLNLHMSF